MKIAVVALACAALQACASAGAPQPGAAAVPGAVQGVLTSAVEYRPLTAAELADPVTRAGVERCERVGERRCREGKSPKDRRTSFTPGIDPHVVAMFGSGRLAPGAAYRTDCRVLNPAGAVVATMPGAAPIVAPTTIRSEDGFRTVCVFRLPPETPAGRWAVEFVVNGQPLRTLSFEVRAGQRPGAGEVVI